MTRNDGKVTATIIHQDDERTIYHAYWKGGENLWCSRSTKSFRENFS